MKTKKYTLLGMLIFLSTFLNAQGPVNSPKVDEMHARKWQFMVEKAQLTPKEAEVVQPIFMEYEKAVWSRHQKDRAFFKSAKERKGNTKPDYSALNDHYAQLDLVQGQLFKNYHLKLRKYLQPETLFRYYKAEREFKRKLLQDMPPRERHDSRP